MKNDKKNFKFYWEEPYEKKEPNIKIEVPGFAKDEINIQLFGNSITVNASKKNKSVQKGKNFYREEAFASSFSRSMTLPYNINSDHFDVLISDGQVSLKKKKKKSLEKKI